MLDNPITTEPHRLSQVKPFYAGVAVRKIRTLSLMLEAADSTTTSTSLDSLYSRFNSFRAALPRVRSHCAPQMRPFDDETKGGSHFKRL